MANSPLLKPAGKVGSHYRIDRDMICSFLANEYHMRHLYDLKTSLAADSAEPNDE
jgi:hypothetical protein